MPKTENFDDVVAFTHLGVYVSISTGNGFGKHTQLVKQFGYDDDRGVDEHTGFLAYVNDDGLVDVVGFLTLSFF